jgi:hypothetical protein
MTGGTPGQGEPVSYKFDATGTGTFTITTAAGEAAARAAAAALTGLPAGNNLEQPESDAGSYPGVRVSPVHFSPWGPPHLVSASSAGGNAVPVRERDPPCPPPPGEAALRGLAAAAGAWEQAAVGGSGGAEHEAAAVMAAAIRALAGEGGPHDPAPARPPGRDAGWFIARAAGVRLDGEGTGTDGQPWEAESDDVRETLADLVTTARELSAPPPPAPGIPVPDYPPTVYTHTGQYTPLGIPILRGEVAGHPGLTTIYPDGNAAVEAWLSGAITTAMLADEVMRAIGEEIEAGEQPADVGCFGDLHMNADANQYLLDVMGDSPGDGDRMTNEVCGVVDARLRARHVRQLSRGDGGTYRVTHTDGASYAISSDEWKRIAAQSALSAPLAVRPAAQPTAGKPAPAPAARPARAVLRHDIPDPPGR